MLLLVRFCGWLSAAHWRTWEAGPFHRNAPAGLRERRVAGLVTGNAEASRLGS